MLKEIKEDLEEGDAKIEEELRWRDNNLED